MPASVGGSSAASAEPAQISKRPVKKQWATSPAIPPRVSKATPLSSRGNSPQAENTSAKAESSTTKAQIFTAEEAAEPTDRTSSTAAGSVLGEDRKRLPLGGSGRPQPNSRPSSRPAASWHRNKKIPTTVEPKMRPPTTPAI